MPLTPASQNKNWLQYYYSHGGTGQGLDEASMARMRKDWEASLQPSSTPPASSSLDPFAALGLDRSKFFGTSETPASPASTPSTVPPTGLSGYQSSVLGSTQQMLPQMTDIANTVNAFNLKQKTGQLEQGLPNYGALTATSSGNIGANLRGELPADVRSMLETSAAERAVGQGMPAGAYGSTMPNFDLLRTLGLTSLARKDLGESQLTGAVARTPQVPIYSPSEQFITPTQAAQYDLSLAYLNKPQLGRTGGGGGTGSGGSPDSNITGAPTPTPFPQPATTQTQPTGWGFTPYPSGPTPNYTPVPKDAPPYEFPNLLDIGLSPQIAWEDKMGPSVGPYAQEDYYPGSFEELFSDYIDYGG